MGDAARRASKPAHGVKLGFEAELWKTADELRGHMDAAEYTHVVLGLIFLKYISDAFAERYAELEAERGAGADPEDKDEYTAEGRFWVPVEARWEAIAAKASRPVVIADTQDNPGCGGTGDTTGMLAALVRNRARKAALCVLTDPKAAAAAHAAGEGAEIEIALGGGTPLPGVEPLPGRFRVARLSSGEFVCKGPCVGGREARLGPTALLEIDGVSVVVASKRMQAYDLEIFRHIGVEPTEQAILVVKSTCHFRADFQPIAERVLVAVAPGAHLVDARQYPYRYLRAGVRLEPMGPAFTPLVR
jgi:microcystin degradation protein MlrC